MSVYRVIDVIGTSTTSWEEAAADAIDTARQWVLTLGSLRSCSRTFTSGTAASSSTARRSSCPSSTRVTRRRVAALIASARVAGRHREHRRPAAACSLTDDHLVPWKGNLLTLRAAHARTSRRSPRSTYDPVSLPRRPCDART